jgi:hypothetical protein
VSENLGEKEKAGEKPENFELHGRQLTENQGLSASLV